MDSPIVASYGGESSPIANQDCQTSPVHPCGKKILTTDLILLAPDSGPELFYLNSAMAAAASVVAAKSATGLDINNKAQNLPIIRASDSSHQQLIFLPSSDHLSFYYEHLSCIINSPYPSSQQPHHPVITIFPPKQVPSISRHLCTDRPSSACLTASSGPGSCFICRGLLSRFKSLTAFVERPGRKPYRSYQSSQSNSSKGFASPC
jgi:hypothetical protein